MKRAALKGYVAGILTMILLSGTVLLANQETRQLVFGVGVSVDGATVDFAEDMRPFIMDGRTFLPVRAIADIAGFDVDFDGATNTVLLTTGGTAVVVQPTPTPVATPTVTPIPAFTPAPTPTPAATAHTLLGDWYWMNILYYEFNTNNRGTMAGIDIRWTTSGGVLSVCNTPDICGTNCPAPMQWNYVFSANGNQMTLTSVLIPSVYFEYTRGQ